MESHSSPENICIVGAGVAGLATLATIMSVADQLPHKEIHVIEKRDMDFSRRQKIASYKNLSEKIGTDWFITLRELFDPKKEFTLNDDKKLIGPGIDADTELNKQQTFLQKLLRQKDQREEEKGVNFSIKELQLALLEYIKEKQIIHPHIKIHWHDESIIQKIDLKEQTVQIAQQVGGAKKTTEGKTEAETKAKTEDETKGKTEVETKAKTEVETWGKTNAETKAKTEDETKDKTNTETKAKTENEIETINFDLLVLSSGANREGVKLVNDAIDEQEIEAEPFKETPFQNQPPRFNCAVRLKLKPLDQIANGQFKSYVDATVRGPNIASENMVELRKLGWTGLQYPEFSLDTNWFKSTEKDWQPRVFIGSEIPEDIYNEPNKEIRRQKIIEWATVLASTALKIPKEYFEFDPKGEDEKHKLNATVFTADMAFIDRAVLNLPDKNGYVAVIGDEAMSSHYQTGASSTFALLEAQTIASSLLKGGGGFEEKILMLDDIYDELKGNLNATLKKAYVRTQKLGNLSFHATEGQSPRADNIGQKAEVPKYKKGFGE